jgi:hypothetical protein
MEGAQRAVLVMCNDERGFGVPNPYKVMVVSPTNTVLIMRVGRKLILRPCVVSVSVDNTF